MLTTGGENVYTLIMRQLRTAIHSLLISCAFFGSAWAGDTTLSLSFGPTYKATQIPNNKTNHGANIGVLTTSLARNDTFGLGENFFNFAYGQENDHDPAQHATHGAELFLASEHFLFSGNAIADKPLFSYGMLKDIRLEVGGEFASKNNGLQTRRKALLIGPNFHFDPFSNGGYVNVGFHYLKEWNNNGIFRRAVSYKPTFETVITTRQPLFWHLRYESLLNWTMPKGEDGFHAKTANSLLVQNRLVLDVGEVVFNRSQFLDSFIGFQYWYNKTGDDHVIKSGAVEETVFFGSSVHF